MPIETIPARVKVVTWETEEIRLFELRAAAGGELPPFTAGAHIDLHLPCGPATGGMVRGYSLVNSQDERHRYVIGVSLNPESRGGSRWMHEALRPGDVIPFSGPYNLFPLAEDAPHSVLMAGGIGITPLMSMIRRLSSLGRSWQLFYCVRSRSAAAFLADLSEWPANVRLHCDDEFGGRFLDLAAAIDAAPAGSHYYCCGPKAMMAEFEAATRAVPPGRVHVEYFHPAEQPALEGGFLVELARSGRTIIVPPGQTILDTLRQAGFDVPSSCEQGICGTCETRVLAGVPDHRDSLLTEAERAAGRTMMICCSGSKSEKLVLDL
ncbi:MAG TPA: PDR/VanB family oxidoreductase [Bryobacteraceae bacterium]|nr:PDR/VanB family oxidoreductase [Bryobacteraceae bacterium]